MHTQWARCPSENKRVSAFSFYALHKITHTCCHVLFYQLNELLKLLKVSLAICTVQLHSILITVAISNYNWMIHNYIPETKIIITTTINIHSTNKQTLMKNCFKSHLTNVIRYSFCNLNRSKGLNWTHDAYSICEDGRSITSDWMKSPTFWVSGWKKELCSSIYCLAWKIQKWNVVNWKRKILDIKQLSINGKLQYFLHDYLTSYTYIFIIYIYFPLRHHTLLLQVYLWS